MIISIIACIAKSNRAIGYQNRLLYHIPSDMTRFRELTTGHTIIMGKKTYESLPHGALPNRKNIVISSTLDKLPGCEVYPSFERAIHSESSDVLYMSKEDSWAASNQEIFIIGGESIYKEALPLASKLYLTMVEGPSPAGDAFFPTIDLSEWKETEKEMRNENDLSFTFLTLERI